jgi:hypothetical protein
VCISILPFLLKYMYQARKVISVCIDLALFIEVHVPSQQSLSWLGACTSIKRARSIYTLITFLAWYMYFNKKGKIDAHMHQARKGISVCIDHVIFIEVHVPSQERDQCVYRSSSIKRARSIYTLITFLVWYMYFNKKKQDQYIEVHAPSQERDQCVYRSCHFH